MASKSCHIVFLSLMLCMLGYATGPPCRPTDDTTVTLASGRLGSAKTPYTSYRICGPPILESEQVFAAPQRAPDMGWDVQRIVFYVAVAALIVGLGLTSLHRPH